ncbi:MAG: EAL domain-containing protein [Proteobacteria bacterium]|nr:EAL domain-containing protein [Pseudomonadota bacterium]
MRPTGNIGIFISLKWKALLLTSLVLLMVTGIFITLNYFELQNQSVARRDTLQKQYSVQVQALLNQFSNRLLMLSTFLASLQTTQTAFNFSRHKSSVENFDPLSYSLELNMGIEVVTVMTADGRRLAQQPRTDKDDLDVNIVSAVRSVVATEKPTTLIDCSNNCLQYAIAPVLSEKGVLGAIVIAASLADVILDFKGVSGTDIGLIVQSQSSTKDKLRWIDSWNSNIIALTNSDNNIELMRSFSYVQNNISTIHNATQFFFQDRQYQIRIYPLSGFNQTDKAYLAIIADITDAMQHIRNATSRSILIGIGGFLLSEIFLLFILWSPMSSLRRSAENLPLLADGEFDKVRMAISINRKKRLFTDEVDVLNETAISLTHQLEALNLEVASRMEEIIREKNFVNNVLDTAQAIILTQNTNQDIIMINPYGSEIMGYTQDELQGFRFSDLLVQQNKQNQASQYLKEIADGICEHMEMECDIQCKNYNILNVVWQHSKLKSIMVNGPVILSVGMDITARKKAEVRLAWLADHDPLTGLYNRRRFEKELEDAIALAKRYRHSGALLYFDLDQFKYVNDTSGHAAGDRLLVMLSSKIPLLLREVDIVGRLGGDEFGVILSHSNAAVAIQVAKKILNHIRETEFQVEDRVHKISASIGVALFPEHGSDVQDLLARTDLAMYHVKESGRGGWYLLSTNDDSHRVMQERVLWKQRMEIALSENLFVLFVQPIVNIKNGLTSHYEVLLRMRGEGSTLIAPSHFIEIAEHTGLIHTLDRMVLSQAALQLALLNDLSRDITLTVNLSGHAFTDPDLLNHIRQVIHNNKLNPKQIIFEMTETAAVTDFDSVLALMKAINSIGCLFALDDFGTGFSSFSYLRQLPFEYIKIDGSFIRNLRTRPDDQVLVKAIAEIAVAFNKKTIAEQVEDAETLAYLKEIGIDYSQGFYTGRPLEITEAFRLIREGKS